MSRITALSMLTEAEGKAYLAERYGAVIEGLQKSLVSASMKNKELSGDPDAGSLEALCSPWAFRFQQDLR